RFFNDSNADTHYTAAQSPAIPPAPVFLPRLNQEPPPCPAG
ncbi:MAG: hypothetical protein RLZZ458_2826, partial [Planctomycetota bacterium]